MQKALVSSLLAALCLAAVYFLWSEPYILTIVLLVLAVGMSKLNTNMRSWVVFSIGFIFGPLAESIGILGGAWEYAAPFVLGVPIWLPFLWGNTALFIVNTERLAHVVYERRTALR